MINLVPVLAMGIWMTLVVATVIQNTRLLRLFRERYPQIAQREIPYVFDKRRHPEKAIYFFRKWAVGTLRADPHLWRERQRFVALVIATAAFWLAGGVAICILGILLTN